MSRKDAAIVVDVPESSGWMAHGGTSAEAVANAQDAISLWLETAGDMGRPIPRPLERQGEGRRRAILTSEAIARRGR